MERVEIGDAVLYLGDCAEIIGDLPRKNAALVSDVPYGMDWDTDSTRFTGGSIQRGKGRDDHGAIEGDAEPFDPTPWLQWPEVIVWGCNHYLDKLPPGGMLVWLKKRPELFGSFLSDCEVAWRKGSAGVFAHYKQFPPPSRMAESGNGQVAHPTQKPLSLMSWCIDLTKAGTIIDPYMGSGTTIVAALSKGRKAIGIEKKPEFFAAAVRRVEAAVKDAAEAARQHDMFVAPAAKPVQTALFGGEAA